MKKLLAKIRKILKDRRTRQLLTRIVSITAAVVVFITTYALVLPAITMESEANCGIPAHQHDDSCYEDRLICGQVESPGHQHTDACYSISKSLICTETEHQHDDSCFDEDGNLTCELAEHTHDDSCYEEVRELVCDIPESEGHEHTDDCYERVLACGMEAHTHSTACYSHGSELTASAPSDFAAVATTELGSYGATVSASTETEANLEETSNTWTSDESATGGVSSTAAATTDAAATDYSSTATAAGTASTGFDATATEDAFVPQLEPIFFEQILTKDTGIYFYHTEEGEEVPENSADIADWKRVNDDTELAPADLLRVYLRYSIPAGALNATNDIARYRLPSNLHLTDQQMEAINTTVNGIANQYVNLDTLEITDTERYNTYLGIEATEGTRKPSDNIDEYFTNHPDLEGQEYINAVVRVENVFDETTEEYLGQDLVFTFTPYTVQKNQHEYDAEGQPTKAGQKVNGWLCFDLHMDQIDWSEPVISTIEDPAAPAQDVATENTEDTYSSDTTEATEKAASDMDEDASLSSSNPYELNTNTITEKKESSAEIVFAAKDEIRTEIHLVEFNTIEKENDAAQDEPDQSADESTDNANSEMTDGKDDIADDSNPEGEADKPESANEPATDTENQPESAMEINAETYPAVSFEDTITVQAGTLSTDNENAAKDTLAETAITVSVIAEEETFPLGTTMQLGTVEDMDTVASAVEGAVEGQTRGFHAVDISFHNADGEEIEPLKPIKVSMTSDAIKQAVEDSSTAPVVVHVENSSESLAKDKDSKGLPANSIDAEEYSADTALHSDREAETSENTPTATIVETNEISSIDGSNKSAETADTLSFDAGSFSVYAIVYTVDFHYAVNGKMYDFSIPGGGFVSLEHVVELLGIANTDAYTENGSENAENGAENASDNAGEVSDIANTATYSAAVLNALEISEETMNFVADVESVTFSSPELVWVGKVDSDSTVGGLKEANELECEYSADLTEEQIAEINAQTVKAGDWALISMQPFMSEESLMVTMKNGDKWTVKVTDAQITKRILTADGKTYEIRVTYGDDAQIPEGSELKVDEITKDDEQFYDYYEKSHQKLNGDETKSGSETEASAADIIESTVDGDLEDVQIPEKDAEQSEEEYTRIFDIQIWNGDEKIEPKAEVRVDIKLLDAPEDEGMSPKVVHFAKDGPEVMAVSLSETEGEESSFSFMTDEFSVYSVTYSVDFLYNGYGFSIKGGDAISLKELAEKLHIVENASEDNALESIEVIEEIDQQSLYSDADAFIADVVNVEFSTPELVLVGSIEEDCSVWDFREKNGLPGFGAFGVAEDDYNKIMTRQLTAPDWVLLSLKPFESQEKLTITLNGGKKIVIDVTDAQDAVMIDDGSGGQKVQTITNPSGTTIDLFDYWIVDNYTYRAADGTNYYITKNTEGRAAWPGHTGTDNFGYDFEFYDYNGTRQSGWHKTQDSAGHWQVDKGYLVGNGNNMGINQGHIYKFTPSTSGGVVDGVRSNGWTNVGGSIGWVQYENAHDYYSNSINSWTGTTTPSQGLFNKTLVNGYPQLSNVSSLGTNGESLDYLFTQSNGTGKEYKGQVDQLLYVDPDGYYTYDSRDYSATYNNDGTFTLRTQTSTDSEVRGFWPFGSRQYWFGMHMTTPFSMPVNGQVLNPKGVYQDMVFEFSGDDDCLLYVDGVLVGDAGGIHLRSDVKINFKTGEVTVSGKSPVYLDDLFRAAGKYNDYQWDGHTFAAGTYHTFEMFYLERGGGESNLHIKYNLVSTTDFSAHKSYHSADNSRLTRDQFKFELIGFDNTDYTNGFVQAIMPDTGSDAGAGTVASPKKVHSNSAPTGIELPAGLTAHTSLITGVTEDGNVNFGNIQIQESQAGKEYKYIVREVVPDDAVNADNIRWDEASDEVKAEGGFVKDGITYDGKVYYFKGVVQLKEGSTSEYELKKYRYTDATYTTPDTVTKFFSFVNGYVQPITLKVLKKSDSGKSLSGAEFSLTRAMKNDSDQWVIRQYQHNGETVSSTPRTDTTNAGVLTFDNLTEGHYILEETNPPAGYEKGSTYRWLLTLTKQDAENKIVLVPTIQGLDADGNLTGTATTLTPDTQNVVEYEVLNGKIPLGPITVEKKWLKIDGTTEYTDAELEALGVDGTKITGELWRKSSGSANPKVTIIAYQNGNSNSTLTKTVEVAYGGSLSYGLANNTTTAQYAGSQYVDSVSISPGNYTLNHESNTRTVRVTNKNNVSWDRSGCNVYTLSNILTDITVTIVYNSSINLGTNGIGYGTVSINPEPSNSTDPVDEKFADFTLQKGGWSKTWSATELYGENQDEDWAYYFKNVTESPSPADFEFTAAPEVSVAGITTTYTYKNIYQKVSVKILKVIKDTETPLAGATFTLTQVDADKHDVKDDQNQSIIQTGTTAETTGELTFEGLIPGAWYKLDETEMPAGYIKKEGPYYIHINDDGTGTLDTTVAYTLISPDSGNEFTIENEPGVALPNTGGPGTRIFTILGSILVMFAGVVLWRRRRLI